MSNQTQTLDQPDGPMMAAYEETPEEKIQRLKEFISKLEGNRNKYITKHNDTLVKYIESKHGLLDKLVSEEVITEIDMAEITGAGTGEKTVYGQNKELIPLIRKVDDKLYLKFLEALAVRQEDLVKLLTDF